MRRAKRTASNINEEAHLVVKSATGIASEFIANAMRKNQDVDGPTG